MIRILKNTRNLRLVNTDVLFRMQSTYAAEEEIVVPKRIPRSPTDILQALSTTVHHDPTGTEYKYHDDPYLIPTTNLNKRSFALSQESGRKSAMWIRQQHPELFQHREAEPPIQAYFPRSTYDELDDVNDELLLTVIKDALVSDAMKIYKLMLKKDMIPRDESKQALLELVCFYNETEDLAEDLIEERWFRQANIKSSRMRKTWKDGKFAEKLFAELPRSDKSYSAIIQGMARYCQMDGAYNYYREAMDGNYSLSVEAFNAMLKAVPMLKEGHEQRWLMILDMLSAMNGKGVRPNLGTLNNALESLIQCILLKDAGKNCLRLIAEMRKFSVEPSLATYHHLIRFFCRDKGQICYILLDILDLLEGKEFKIRDPNDTLFFGTAMENCRYHLHDKEAAYRVNNLLKTGNNYNLIGNGLRESVYYRNYFTLLCDTELLEPLMEEYNYYVPSLYIPEPSVLKKLIDTATMNGAVDLYPKLWSDIITFDVWAKEGLVSSILNGMLVNRKQKSSQINDVPSKFAEIASSIFDKGNDVSEFYFNDFDWNGEMLGVILTLCLEGGEFDKGLIVLKKIMHKSKNLGLMGPPSVESLSLFVDACIYNKDAANALMCIEFAIECGYSRESQSMGLKLSEALDMNAADSAKLSSMIGADVTAAREKAEKEALLKHTQKTA